MRLKSILIFTATMGIVLAGLGACSPGYVLRAAYEQSKIVLGKEKISEVVADPRTSTEEREKLTLVLAAREYGMQELRLNPKRAFTQFARLNKESVSWVVSASRKDSFSLFQWWFPIVGHIPYKGFFDKSDALAEAQQLEAQDYETWVRGTDAFSTLGWFDDPLLSTTLKNSAAHVVNTVLHESLHTTLWIPNHVDFNESLANFFGLEGAVQFFRYWIIHCSEAGRENPVCSYSLESHLQHAEYSLAREYDLAFALRALYSELLTLYNSELPSETKIQKRSEIFDRVMKPVRAQYPELRILRTVNNAEILQLQLYLKGMDKFHDLYGRCNRDWSRFFSEIRAIAETTRQDSRQDPYKLVEDTSCGTPADL